MSGYHDDHDEREKNRVKNRENQRERERKKTEPLFLSFGMVYNFVPVVQSFNLYTGRVFLCFFHPLCLLHPLCLFHRVIHTTFNEWLNGIPVIYMNVSNGASFWEEKQGWLKWKGGRRWRVPFHELVGSGSTSDPFFSSLDSLPIPFSTSIRKYQGWHNDREMETTTSSSKKCKGDQITPQFGVFKSCQFCLTSSSETWHKREQSRYKSSSNLDGMNTFLLLSTVTTVPFLPWLDLCL